jgi:hypothetical protein
MGLSQVQHPDSNFASSPGAVHERACDSQWPSYDYFRAFYTVAVLVLLVFIIRKAWLDLDESWDSLAYHMPFAALRAGVITQQQYHLSKWISGLYAGMPVLPDYLQGGLWRLTSRAQAANFVSLFALMCVTSFFRLRHKIPFAYILAGFLGIPVILIQSTSACVDLFTNSFATMLLFSIFTAWIDPEDFSVGDAAIALLCVAVVINSKTQFIVIGTLALFGLALVTYVNRRRLILMRKQLLMGSGWTRYLFVLIVFLSVSLAYVVPVRNLIKFHNPFYPVAVSIGHIYLPGQFNARGLGDEPLYLSHSRQWKRWLLSVVEYEAFDGRNPLWTNGQGDVGLNSKALRMGGTFGALALFNIFLFMILQAKVRDRYGMKPSVFLLVIILITAFMPASQEIRYYSYWLMCLIALNLFMIENGLNDPERRTFKQLAAAAIASFLLFVLCSTGFRYVRATHHSPEVLVKGANIEKQFDDMHLRKGEAICVEGKMPRTFLYSPNFNPGAASRFHYRVLEGYQPQDEAEDCGTNRILR